MSSCHCNHSPCSCGQLQADVSPYRSVTLASRLLSVDRNGRPVTLDKQPFSIPSTDADGNVALRDGSEEDSILLPYLQPLPDGRSVLIRNGRGVLGVVDAVEDGSFLTFSGGSVQWSKIFPRDNAFRDGALVPATGKLVVTGCSVDGYTELGFIDTVGDYVSIGASGNASSKNFCDAESKTELAFIFGCLDGKLVKLGPSAGKVLRPNTDGDKWIVSDEESSSNISLSGMVYKQMYPGSAGATGTYVTSLPTDGPSATIELPWDAMVMITFMLTGDSVGSVQTYTSMMVGAVQYGPPVFFAGAVAAPPVEVGGEGTMGKVTLCIELAKGTHIAKFGVSATGSGNRSVDFAGISWMAVKKSL